MNNQIYIVSRKILFSELNELFMALSNVRYAVVKGDVLSQQIYGVPYKRHSRDIDILIDKKDVYVLENELLKLGFEQKVSKKRRFLRENRILCMMYSHQIPSYYKEKFGIELNVDVNFDIFWGEYEGIRYPIEDFLSDVTDIVVYGVNVKTLPLYKAFIQLILHHYKEMNSLYHLSQYNTIQTNMFKDVYDMLRLGRELLNIETIKELCETYHIGQYVYYILYYTYQVYLDEFLLNYLCELERYKNDELLNSYGLSLKERKIWTASFKDRLDNLSLVDVVRKNLNDDDRAKLEVQSLHFL